MKEKIGENSIQFNHPFIRKEEIQDNFKVHFLSIQKLFSEFGIRNVTMDDIAHNLHVSKKTIYKYYSCKEELVCDIYRNDCYRFKGSLNALKRENIEAISKTIQLYNLLLINVLSIKTHIHYDLKKYYPDLLHEIAEQRSEAVYNTCIEILHEGIAENYFQKDIRPSSVANVFKLLIESYTINRLSKSKEKDVLTWVDIFDYYFKCICNPVGLERWSVLKELA